MIHDFFPTQFSSFQSSHNPPYACLAHYLYIQPTLQFLSPPRSSTVTTLLKPYQNPPNPPTRNCTFQPPPNFYSRVPYVKTIQSSNKLTYFHSALNLQPPRSPGGGTKEWVRPSDAHDPSPATSSAPEPDERLCRVCRMQADPVEFIHGAWNANRALLVSEPICWLCAFLLFYFYF